MVKRYVIGFFESDKTILKAVRMLKKEGVKIYDAYTPYAVHGLDEAMGLRRSRLGIVTFFAGAIGCAIALLFQVWTSAFDWPVNVGGKPGNSWPAFIPVTFELTVLIGGLVTVAAFFMRSKLLWGNKIHLPIEGVTDDAFALILDNTDGGIDISAAERRMQELGATKVMEQVLM